MNLELIKNNIIFRLITKKEFDRLTKQLEATKDEFPYRKWNDLFQKINKKYGQLYS